MAEIRANDVEKLTSIAQQLAAMVESYRAQAIETPEELRGAVEAAVKIRQCLVCGKSIPKGKRYVRGQCGSCGVKLRTAMETGEVTETDLILQGAITATPKAGGRTPENHVHVEELLASIRKSRDKPRDTNKPK